ncbi:hypothetical protein DESPIGER_0977 [Desulfovibrio piger]|uniref:Uncharacterized protein n=1 Tax=Desulfovibrio piger TaxID=901 RepID=A0A1K1LDQ6_9BACT|nr:hypothetical protein DESPIGER_0977 [Desulfovibrio piger]
MQLLACFWRCRQIRPDAGTCCHPLIPVSQRRGPAIPPQRNVLQGWG